MTSSDLVQHVLHQSVFRPLQRAFDPLEVYYHANLVQAEILRETRLLHGSATPTFVADQAVYTSADSGWEFLAKAGEIISAINSNNAPISLVDQEEVDAVRYNVTQTGFSPPDPPLKMYHVLTDPLSLGFWGTPATATAVTIRYVRIHTTSDDITSSNDPIIPDAYRDLLITGVVLSILNGKAFEEIKGIGRGKVYENLLIALQRFENKYDTLKLGATIRRGGLAASNIGMPRRIRI